MVGARDWFRGFVCGRVRIRGVVYGLRETAGICAVRGVSNYCGNCGFSLGVEAWAVGIEIEQMLGEPCAALRGFVLQAEMVPPLPLHFVQGKRGGRRSFVPDGTGKWMDVSVPGLFRRVTRAISCLCY